MRLINLHKVTSPEIISLIKTIDFARVNLKLAEQHICRSDLGLAMDRLADAKQTVDEAIAATEGQARKRAWSE